MTTKNQSQARPPLGAALVSLATGASLLLALTAGACSSDDGSGSADAMGADASAETDTGTDVCPSDHLSCGAVCVDLVSDHDHCGSCTTVCGPDQFCRNAQCRTCAEDGLMNCEGRCSDLLSDPNDCGTCGNACSAAEQCRNGNCVNPCPEGQISCSDKCIDPTVDTQNCGSCGHVCPAGQACNDSACTCADASLVSCDGTCLNPKTERNHCGATPGCGFNTGWAGSTCVTDGFCSEGTCRLCQTWSKTWSFDPSPYDSSSGMRMITADFDQDGKLDIAALDIATAKLIIQLGNGDGTFRTGASYAVGAAPSALVAFDYDGDGKKDIAVGKKALSAPPAFDYLVVFRGNGDGTFGAGTNVDRETWVDALAAGDLDGDGRDDLVAAGGDSWVEDVRVYLSKPSGNFALGPNFAQRLYDLNGNASASDLTITDLDGDGQNDLAFLPLTVLFGKGDGSFGDAWLSPPGMSDFRGLVVADVTGDGKSDLFWHGAGPSDQWWLAANDGKRAWKYPSLVLFGGEYNVTFGDVTGDGVGDLIGVGTAFPSHVYVRGGRGDGTFVAEEQYDFSTNVAGTNLVIDDLDGNGIADIVSSSYNGVLVLTGQKSSRAECQ